jgi:hypothetical protein
MSRIVQEMKLAARDRSMHRIIKEKRKNYCILMLLLLLYLPYLDAQQAVIGFKIKR